MKKLFSILVSAALLATANYSLAKQENPYQVGTGSYELSREQIDFLIQYINQSKIVLESAVIKANSQELYTSFQTLLFAAKKVIPLSFSIKPRDELLLRVALNQALELTVGVPNANGKGVVKKGVLASSIALSSNIDLYNIILSDSINLALKFSEFDSKAVSSGVFIELPYDKFSMERLALLRQWSSFYMPEPTAYEFLRTGLTQWLSSMNPKYLLTKNAEYAESLVAAQDELNASNLKSDTNRVQRLKSLISEILKNYKNTSKSEFDFKSPTDKNSNIGPLDYSGAQITSNANKSGPPYSASELIGDAEGEPCEYLYYSDYDECLKKYEKKIKPLALRKSKQRDASGWFGAFAKVGMSTNQNGAPIIANLSAGFMSALAFQSKRHNFQPQIFHLESNANLNLDLTKHFASEESVNHFDVNATVGLGKLNILIEKDNKYIGYFNIYTASADLNYINDIVDEKNKSRIELFSATWKPAMEFHTFFPLTQSLTGEFCFFSNPVGVGAVQVIGRQNENKNWVLRNGYDSLAVQTEHSACFGINILGFVEVKDQISSKFLIFMPDENNERQFIMNISNELTIDKIGGPNSPFGAYYEFNQKRYMKDDLNKNEISTDYVINRHMFGIKLEY